MSVENTSKYPSGSYSSGNTTGSSGSNAGTETNIDALRSAFAVAMQRSMSGASSTSESLFEMADIVQKSSAQHREESKRDQRQADPYHALGDRKSMDQTELRDRQLAGEYNGRIDRHRQQESEYRQGIDQKELIAETTNRNTMPLGETASASLSTGNGPPGSTVSPPVILPSQSNSPPNLSSGETVVSSTLNLSANDASVVPATTSSAINPVVMPMQPIPVLAFPGGIPPTLLGTASVLTIFTVSGRFGQEKSETEKEKEIASTRKKEKKESSSSVLATEMSGMSGDTVPGSLGFGSLGSGSLGSDSLERVFQGEIRETAAIPSSDAQKRDEKKKESPAEFVEDKPKKEAPANSEHSIPVPPNLSGTETAASHGSGPSIHAASEDVSESNAEEQMDRVRLIQRIAAACQSGAHQNGTIQVKLNLDRFGSLTVRMTKRSDRLDVRFDAETESALRLLRENVDELKTVLAERNVHLDQIEFTIGQPD